MNADTYMTTLLARQAAAWDGTGLPPLLESMVLPGDEALFTPPPVTPQPKRATTPRVYQTAASLRDERDRLDRRRLAIITIHSDYDPAAINIPLAKRGGNIDRDLERYADLTRRIDALNGRIDQAEAREA